MLGQAQLQSDLAIVYDMVRWWRFIKRGLTWSDRIISLLIVADFCCHCVGLIALSLSSCWVLTTWFGYIIRILNKILRIPSYGWICQIIEQKLFHFCYSLKCCFQSCNFAVYLYCFITGGSVVWSIITYPCPGCLLEMWSHLQYMWSIITYPCPGCLLEMWSHLQYMWSIIT